jgi:hypothetical protein
MWLNRAALKRTDEKDDICSRLVAANYGRIGADKD